MLLSCLRVHQQLVRSRQKINNNLKDAITNI